MTLFTRSIAVAAAVSLGSSGATRVDFGEPGGGHAEPALPSRAADHLEDRDLFADRGKGHDHRVGGGCVSPDPHDADRW